jgi:cytochrome c6
LKKITIATGFGIALVVGCFIVAGENAWSADKTGEALFKQHCAVCHPGGSNIMNAKKTLHKADRTANGVKTADDIIKKMRNPGPGMTKFDTKTLPNNDAREIAEYIMKTF